MRATALFPLNNGSRDRDETCFHASPGPGSFTTMSPRRTTVEHSKGVFEVEWPLFGELSRGLALKVARDYDPEIVVGIATAGVVPGAVIAAILEREFHSIVVSRRFGADTVRETPAVLGAAPPAVRGNARARRRRNLRHGRHDAAGRRRDRQRGRGRSAHGRRVSDGPVHARTSTRSRPRARSCCRGTARC